MENTDTGTKLLAEQKDRRTSIALADELDLEAIGLNVDESTFYESKHTLHAVRVVLFTISTIYWSVCLYSHDIDGFLKYCRFFTFWGQTMVNMYLFWVIVYYPKRRLLSNGTIMFQQAILTCQTMVVVVYWCLLAPGLGYSQAFSFRRVYDHVVPFLFMIHELVVTYGHYTIHGEILGVIIFLSYSLYNVIICFAFDWIPYDTPISNPHQWLTYVAISLSLALVFLFGRIYTFSKQRIMKRLHFKRVKKMEISANTTITRIDSEALSI